MSDPYTLQFRSDESELLDDYLFLWALDMIHDHKRQHKTVNDDRIQNISKIMARAIKKSNPVGVVSKQLEKQIQLRIWRVICCNLYSDDDFLTSTCTHKVCSMPDTKGYSLGEYKVKQLEDRIKRAGLTQIKQVDITEYDHSNALVIRDNAIPLASMQQMVNLPSRFDKRYAGEKYIELSKKEKKNRIKSDLSDFRFRIMGYFGEQLLVIHDVAYKYMNETLQCLSFGVDLNSNTYGKPRATYDVNNLNQKMYHHMAKYFGDFGQTMKSHHDNFIMVKKGLPIRMYICTYDVILMLISVFIFELPVLSREDKSDSSKISLMVPMDSQI